MDFMYVCVCVIIMSMYVVRSNNNNKQLLYMYDNWGWASIEYCGTTFKKHVLLCFESKLFGSEVVDIIYSISKEEHSDLSWNLK